MSSWIFGSNETYKPLITEMNQQQPEQQPEQELSYKPNNEAKVEEQHVAKVEAEEEQHVAKVLEITSLTSGDFRGFVIPISSGISSDEQYKINVPNIATMIDINKVKSINSASSYIINLRKAIQGLVMKILTSNRGTIQEAWNMAVRDGDKKLELMNMANGYYDNAQAYHSYEESGMVVGTDKYPIDLLLFGLDKYLQLHPETEQKTTDVISVKTITVNTGEIRRFPFVDALKVVELAFQKAYPTENISIDAEFVKIYDDDGKGVPMGTWSVFLHWFW